MEIMTDQQLENLLGSMITNDASCRSEIKSRIAVQKQQSTSRGLSSPANWTSKQATSVMNSVVLW
jgi:hypothetical protein